MSEKELPEFIGFDDFDDDFVTNKLILIMYALIDEYNLWKQIENEEVEDNEMVSIKTTDGLNTLLAGLIDYFKPGPSEL